MGGARWRGKASEREKAEGEWGTGRKKERKRERGREREKGRREGNEKREREGGRAKKGERHPVGDLTSEHEVKKESRFTYILGE